MIHPLAFAAHLAALARAPEPESPTAAQLLASVAADWTRLAGSAVPTFELDGELLWLCGRPVRLATAWREALRSLEGSLRAHGAGGVRVEGAVDTQAVLALVRGGRSLPPAAPREELQRWVAQHGGQALTFLAPRAPSTLSPTPALRALLRTWRRFSAASGADLAPAARALVSCALATPDGLPRLLALPSISDASPPGRTAALALILGIRLGLDRSALLDLTLAAAAVARLPDRAPDAVLRAVAGCVPLHPSRTALRELLALGALLPGAPTPGLLARVACLAADAEPMVGSARGDGAPGPEALAQRGEAGRSHDPMLLQLLLGALGRYQVGEVLVLDTGEIGMVVDRARPGAEGRPTLLLLVDKTGAAVSRPVRADLAAAPWTRLRVLGRLPASSVGVELEPFLFPTDASV